MTNEELTKRFLELLSGYWDDSEVHRGFKELRKQAAENSEWERIIGARLSALEYKTEEAVASLEAILDKDPQTIPPRFCSLAS